MTTFTTRDLKRLMGIEDEVCMSLFMPTDPAAATIDKHRIRFKNLLRQAENTARERAPKSKALVARLAEAERLLLRNDYFWSHQSQGLAVFIAPEVFLFYRLPVHLEEAFSVANRFAVKPLIPMFMADGRFYILALSQARIRLFDCSRHHVMEVELVDVPDGISESLQYDDKQSQLQFHTRTAGGGARPAVFHGHGVGIDDRKDEILRYFQDVNRGLADILADPQVPLVLAGVDYLIPIFREASSYGWLMPQAVIGNPDALRGEELHEKALPIVRPELERSLREAAHRYRELAGRGATTVAAGVRNVVPAAAYGRVETLFVALDERRPGTFDRRNNQVTILGDADPRAEDLLDLAAVETLKNSGRVYAVKKGEMPEENAPAAAILRY